MSYQPVRRSPLSTSSMEPEAPLRSMRWPSVSSRWHPGKFRQVTPVRVLAAMRSLNARAASARAWSADEAVSGSNGSELRDGTAEALGFRDAAPARRASAERGWAGGPPPYGYRNAAAGGLEQVSAQRRSF